MNNSPDAAPKARTAWWAKLAVGFAAFFVVLALVVVFFPWDWLRGPVNRYVSEQTGRQFEITRQLDVKLGLTPRVIADGIEFANPAWARDPYLVKAESAEFEIKLWPLLRGRVELPLVSLRQPVFGLQMQPDGRRTWALGKDTSNIGTVPVIDLLLVDQGTLHYLAEAQGADIKTEFAIAGAVQSVPGTTAAVQDLPLSYKARGTWKKESFVAQGRTGSVLQVSEKKARPFPIEVHASAGRTTLQAKGSIGNLAALDGLDANFDLKGQTLADLYNLLGVVLPDTPAYALRGHLGKQGPVWNVAGIQGRLGQSDLSGDLVYDRSGRLALLSGKLQSKALDFDDLGPLVGVPVTASGRTTKTVAKGQSSSARQVQAVGKVLPTATLDLDRLKTMNADVWYKAAEVKNANGLPLERMEAHIRLTDGVLQLDPLDLGVAGGRLAGLIRIDANTPPVAVQARLDARTLQLSRLFPRIERTKGSLGKLNGRIELTGRGNSIAQVLGSSSGSVALLMGKGEVSNILLEYMGLDGGEIIQFLVGGDRNVSLRCAAAAFDVKQGLMTSRAILLDTSDTVVNGNGQINLANETLNLVLYPQPKDRSILSLRSPLRITGTFAHPSAGPDKAALAGRAGIALLLGAINPLLALAATVETGPGKDADCERVLALASPVKPPEKPDVSAPAVK